MKSIGNCLPPLRIASVTLVVAMAMLIAQVSAGQKENNFVVTEKSYVLPEVTLVDSAGEPVLFSQVGQEAERTVISFIFTSCAGICPMITANMVRAVPALNALGDDYQILLISVDPEYDTPVRLREYAHRFKADARIRFLTGDRENVFRVLRSLEALYEGSNKMNHQPVTLISRNDADDWLRIDGLIGSEVLVDQYRNLVESHAG